MEALRRSFRGYDRAQVDRLLSELQAQVESTRREQARLSEELEAARRQARESLEREQAVEKALTSAHRQAEEILADTDEYIIDQLSELEEQLMKTLTTVRNGLRPPERGALTGEHRVGTVQQRPLVAPFDAPLVFFPFPGEGSTPLPG